MASCGATATKLSNAKLPSGCSSGWPAYTSGITLSAARGSGPHLLLRWVVALTSEGLEVIVMRWNFFSHGHFATFHLLLAGPTSGCHQSGSQSSYSTEEDQDAERDFIIQQGQRDKGELKQLHKNHKNIDRDGSPIKG